MAKPKVFLSSTYYDLKHIRSSMEGFIESLGYEPVLSEKGSIAYQHDKPLDKSCYREVENCDIFVLIIGGRYGSPISDSEEVKRDDFYERYESVTKQEFESALKQDLPVYILIERNVLAEYETFKNNKDNTDIKYAHADSVNIFHFIDRVFNLKQNNPVKEFDKHNDIEDWLKNQWAGLFRELIHSKNHNTELKDLKTQIESLSDLNTTLKRYLEELVSNVPDNKGIELIKQEKERLHTREIYNKASKSPMIDSFKKYLGVEEFVEIISNASDFKDFAMKLSKIVHPNESEDYFYDFWTNDVLQELVDLCELLNLASMQRDIEKHMLF